MSVEKRVRQHQNDGRSPKRPKTEKDGSDQNDCSGLPFDRLPCPCSNVPEPESQRGPTPSPDAMGQFDFVKGDYDRFPILWMFRGLVDAEKSKKKFNPSLVVAAPADPDPEFFRMQCLTLLAQVGLS